MGLVVEKQPVFGAVGGKVEMNADVGEAAVAMSQHAGFGACEDTGGNEGGGVAVYALCFGCPDKGVDVAQAAGASLCWVRVVRRVPWDFVWRCSISRSLAR